jgi:signal transduction histidine kinase
MKTAKQRETDAREVYEHFWESYQKGDLECFASTLDDNFEMIGTSASEICHSKEEGVAFFKAQIEELVGKAEMRNRQISTKSLNDMVLVNESCDIYVWNESEWVYYSKIRISTLLHETELGWKVIQQHGSLPDMRVQEGETIAIEKINRENLELRDAVMRRTQELASKNRELEIEAALERVRAVAMGMKSPDNMFQVCRVISYELSQFGIQGIRNIQAVIIQEKRKIYDCYQYFPAYNEEILEHTEYLKNPVESALVNRMLEAKDGYFEGSLTGQEFQEFRTHRKEENHLADPLMDGVDEIFYFFYSIGPGALGITLYQELSPDGLAIFKRFHQVFSLAYSRFRDIEKAEAQAREAQIEAALERVRAETMAMHSSEDVGKCILKMFAELTALGVYEGTRFGIGILNHDNENNQLWTARKDGEEVKMHIGNLDMASHPLLKSARKAWKAQIPFHKYVLEGEDLLDYYKMLNKAPDYKIQIPIEKLPKREIQHCFIFEHGFFYAFSPNEFQPELIHTIQRFTSQFAQTYRRYLDLVMAEAQTREARIEAALEKVRSRSLAMHKSEELKEVIQVVYDQFLQLKIHVDHAGFIIDYKERDDMHIWLADHQQGVPTEITIPYFDSPHWNSFREAKANGDNFFANLLPFEVKNKFYRNIFELIPEVTEDAQQTIFSKPALAISTVLLNNVGLYIEHYSETPFTSEENAILMRFGKVFQQTYTRFLDLQNAETQTRESQINLAVERVRATAMAMHQTTDLDKVNKELLNQLNWLQVPGLSGVTFYLIDENGWVKAWDFSSPGNMGEQSSYTLQFDSNRHEMLGFPFKILQQTDLNYFVADYPLEKLEKAVYEFEEIDPAMAKIVKEALSTGALTHQWTACARISNGLLGIDLVSPPSEDTKTIILKMAGAFNQAYMRFLDLQKAEAQAREAKIEAALERIRSRSLAMFKTDDLRNVVTVLFEQMQGLSVDMDFASVSIFIFKEGKRNLDQWIQLPAGVASLHVPYFEHPILSDLFDAKESGADYFAKVYTLEEKNSWVAKGFELTDYKNLPLAFKTSLLEAPGYAMSITLAKNSGICIPSFIGAFPSAGDVNILKRAGKVFEQAYIRFLDLQKAEAQARESKIEAGLEKVRASTMAMHDSKDLSTTIAELFSQLRELNLRTIRCGIAIFNDSSGRINAWTASEGEEDNPIKRAGNELLTGHPLLEGIFEAWQNQKEYSYELKGDDLKKYYEVIGKSNFPVARPSKNSGHLAQYYLCVMFPAGGLFALKDSPFTESEKMLMRRFSDVFHLTFIRHLDLMKAEAQARESEIQLALERVRAKTMAMHSSSDLGPTSAVLFQQIADLGFETWSCGFCIWKEDDHIEAWMGADTAGSSLSPILLNYKKETTHNEIYKSFLKGESSHERVWEGQELEAHYDYMQTIPSVKTAFAQLFEAGLTLPTYQCYNIGFFKQGYLIIITKKQNPELKDLSVRFANVFEQTYTRFLDLQKAEAQTREAEIELALERVRARTMAMQHSNELAEASFLLDQQVRSLGIRTRGCAFHIYGENDSTEWFSSEQGTMPVYHTPRENVFLEYYEAGQRGEAIHIKEFAGGDCATHYDYLCTLPVMGEALKELKASGGSFPERQIDHVTFFKYGYLLFITLDEVPDSHDVFRRFAKVFEQTYTRFLDLQKAEAQIRNEKIKNALERVRSRSLAMHKSAELTDVIQTVSEQFKELEIDISGGAFIVINQDLEKGFYCWGAGGVGNYVRKVKIPFIDRPIYQTLSNGIKNVNPFFTEYYDVEEKRAFFKHLFKYHPFKDTPSSRQESLLAEESDYARSCVVSKNTSIFIINHDGKQFSEEENELLREMGRVFEQAYIRFIDLEKAEKQARLISEERDRLEITLDELKATQAQLIQQEKLASLGQLTAGIAHEIKNPLNFVNNFSDLSRELIDEVFEELENLEASATKEEIIAILQDVQSNLTKVHEHGTRADSIVTSMLQHSRASGSKREPKAFNPLVKEFVNLSFHGMRAGKAPINVDIDLQLDPAVGEVNLISEDFSRVILNLCNNGFDAMREKTLQGFQTLGGLEPYLPKLTVTTALQKDKVILSIGDNGGGIPEEIRDKILQPFFTTKKGTDGTGLGLSITNDIIKAHGGSLDIQSQPGNTIFKIHLTL